MTESAVAGKRIAIVCGHFAPDIGYQEVDLARAFTRLGAAVRVVTSTKLSQNARTLIHRTYQPGSERADGYEVIRVKPRIAIGPNLVGPRVTPLVAEFDPDVVILVGPGKLFGTELFSSAPTPWRKVAVIQDNSEDGSARNRAGKSVKRLAHRLVKQPVYRRVIRHADRIILNVPDTYSLVERWLGAREREVFRLKAIELRLGFDTNRFFFDPDARSRWRIDHGVLDTEILVVTCTRVVPSKGLEVMIEAVSAARGRGVPIRYALAGLADDDYGRNLQAFASAQPEPDAFFLMHGVSHDEMRQLFCAGDIGFWPRAAITIQQAMGTGLPILVRRRPTVSRLLSPGRNGWYFDSQESLEDATVNAAKNLSPNRDERLASREAIAEQNRSYLSYEVIATAMVDGLA